MRRNRVFGQFIPPMSALLSMGGPAIARLSQFQTGAILTPDVLQNIQQFRPFFPNLPIYSQLFLFQPGIPITLTGVQQLQILIQQIQQALQTQSIPGGPIPTPQAQTIYAQPMQPIAQPVMIQPSVVQPPITQPIIQPAIIQPPIVQPIIQPPVATVDNSNIIQAINDAQTRQDQRQAESQQRLDAFQAAQEQLGKNQQDIADAVKQQADQEAILLKQQADQETALITRQAQDFKKRELIIVSILGVIAAALFFILLKNRKKKE